jgi:hypothetical protein
MSIHTDVVPCKTRKGANPTTSEFTTTTPALKKARAFLQRRRKHFCFPNALGYSCVVNFYIYNASAVKIYKATSSRFENKKVLSSTT